MTRNPSAHVASRLSRRDRIAACLALVLTTIWLSVGCSPSTIGFLLTPWVDDKIPAKCKLSKDKGEVTIAVVCNFTKPITNPHLLAADQDLADRFVQSLTKSFKENKEKVKIVPLGQVRSYQRSMASSGVISEQEIGRHFNADYVLALEINSMELYEPRSNRQLFRGRTEVGVRVLDLSKSGGEGSIFDQIYISEYPRQGPIDAGSSSPLQFRGLFLTRVSRELTQWFSAYPSDQKYDTMVD